MKEVSGQVIVSLIVPLVLVVGSWFTMQADLRHLEERLTMDEQNMVRDITEMENRVHVLELDAQSRLAGIEARLVSIETYIVDLHDYVRSSLETVDP